MRLPPHSPVANYGRRTGEVRRLPIRAYIAPRDVMGAHLEGGRIRHLLQLGRELVGEHDAVLRRVLSEARAMTGARYAALGVLDESRLELERFLTLGVDDATHRRIGHLPR